MSSPILIPQSPCLSIHDFFQKSYNVPDFQRGYAWKEEQVTQLLEDIQAFIDSSSQVYLLGQVIVCSGKHPEDFVLVDGQQRVTTLQLLLIAIHKRFSLIPNILSSTTLAFTANRLAGLIMRETHAPGSDALRAKVTVAAEGIPLVEAYLHSRELPPINGWTRENIKEAYDTINAFIDDQWPDVNQIPDLYQKIVNRIFLVRLELPDIDMAVDTFEKINNRGLGLNSADLIKNVIFQKVNDDDFQERVSTDWDSANATLYLCKTGRIRNIEYLLRAMLFGTRGEAISTRMIRDAWREDLHTAGDAIAFARSLPVEASYLRAIDQGKTPRGEDTRAHQGARYFGSVQNYPILLAAAHLSRESFEILGRFVDDRTVVSLLAKERPQDFERFVPRWCHAVKHLSVHASYEDIKAACAPAYEQLEQLLALVRVNILALRTRRSTDKKRIRYLLARISRKIQIDAAVPAVPELAAILYASAATKGQTKLGYDLEHINPMSLHSQNPLTDSIGNLVLAHPADQRDARDRDPSEKSDVYRTSNLVLTQSLCPEETLVSSPSQRIIVRRIHESAPPYLHSWNDEAIRARAELYFNIFASDIAFKP